MNALNRRRLLTSGAAAAIFAASGLGASAAPVRGGHLRLGLSGAHPSDGFSAMRPFGPFMKVAGAGLLFETLTEVTADGTLRGELASQWESRDGAHAWDIQLRRGVSFHDGQPFTADDAVASLRRHLRSGPATPGGRLLTEVTAIRRLSVDRIRIELASARVDFPFLLSDPHLVMHPARNAQAALRAGLGTGLYRLQSFAPGRRLLAERVSGHWKDGDAGWFDSVELLALPSRQERIEALLHGRVDLIDDLDPEAAEVLRRMPRFEVATVRGNGQIVARAPRGLSAGDAFALRQALVHGLPRGLMADRLLAGHGAPGWDTPVGPVNIHAEARPDLWDPDRARRLLEDAGLSGLPLALGRRAAGDDVLAEAVSRAGFEIATAPEAVTFHPASGRPTEDWAFSTGPAPDLPWVAGEKTRTQFDALLRRGRAISSSAARADVFADLQRLVAALGTVAVPLHADFLFAGTSRLAHGPIIGRTATLDDGRVAERWWFA
ncbi:ABC transporter substrate-binding protein [Palleronia sp. KMU-117]|uniref:ABC transporter substrate-binding protein n=1 Tax=Palleronia sp. KMU-117 TaxID=3434108 RepID=UPI003D735ED6